MFAPKADLTMNLIEYTSKNRILQTNSEVSSRTVLDKNILKKKSHFSPYSVFLWAYKCILREDQI